MEIDAVGLDRDIYEGEAEALLDRLRNLESRLDHVYQCAPEAVARLALAGDAVEDAIAELRHVRRAMSPD